MIVLTEGFLWLIRFMIGACIFSFLNVVADRLPREESVVRGRSHCTVCGRTLGPLELIPCVSFLALRGKCKGCKTAIPKRCFLSECLGGAAFVCCGMKFGCGALGILSLGGAVVFCYIGILLVVALIDWDTQMIYDRFHILILLLGMASLWLFPQHGPVDRLIGALVIAVPMLLLTLLIPGAFGGGDIKLMAVSGWFLGCAPVICAMFFGILTGGTYAGVMLATKKLGGKDHFAFSPFLAAGLMIGAVWGDAIATWYLRFL